MRCRARKRLISSAASPRRVSRSWSRHGAGTAPPRERRPNIAAEGLNSGGADSVPSSRQGTHEKSRGRSADDGADQPPTGRSGRVRGRNARRSGAAAARAGRHPRSGGAAAALRRGARRPAPRAAAGEVHRPGRGDLHREQPEVPGRDRHRGADRLRELARHAGAGRGGGQHRPGAGRDRGLRRRPPPLRRQADRADRPRRLPRRQDTAAGTISRRPTGGAGTRRPGSACPWAAPRAPSCTAPPG